MKSPCEKIVKFLTCFSSSLSLSTRKGTNRRFNFVFGPPENEKRKRGGVVGERL